jgi:hypothetical protein
MTALHRSVVRAQALPGRVDEAVAYLRERVDTLSVGHKPGDLLTVSLFQWGNLLIAYWECVARLLSPETLLGERFDLLEAWPGMAQSRAFVPMMDIFHYQESGRGGLDPLEDWRRKAPVERVGGRLARLKHPMVSSYIFYHYQLQEERPGRVDKYGLITLHEDLIFFYQEYPPVVEEPFRAGKLSTANTPDHWHDVMFPHFSLWDDAPPGQEIWREISLIAQRSG